MEATHTPNTVSAPPQMIGAVRASPKKPVPASMQTTGIR